MKKIQSFILIPLLFLSCVSCFREILPESDLSFEGRWALVEDGYDITAKHPYGRTVRYMELSAGTLYGYVTGEHHDISDGVMYSCYPDDFALTALHPYSVEKKGSDRFFIVNGRNMGKISDVSDKSFKIGPRAFMRIESFTSSTLRKLGSIEVDKSDRKHWMEGGMILSDDEKTVVNLILLPETATDKEIEWISSNPGIVSVSQNGLLHAVSGGYVTITASNKTSGLSCSFKVSSEINLAGRGTANCYLVSDSCFFYSFPAVSGFNGENLKNVDRAEVLWVLSEEHYTADNIIDSLGVKDGRIYFTCPQTKDWNALIAAKNAAGDILWSWHIWKSTGYDPDAEEKSFYLDSKNPSRLMSRNLGALSAEPDTLNAGSGDAGLPGLFYQPGRKDPFPGRDGDANAFDPSGAGKWPVEVVREAKTLEWSVKNPMTVIYPVSGFWCSEAGYTGWLYESGRKSRFDPCPPGWQIGKHTYWKTPMKCRRDANGHNGVWIESTAKDGSEIWMETAGMVNYKTYADDEPISYRQNGRYWLAPADTETLMPMMIISENTGTGTWSTEVIGQEMNYRASVRCVKQPIML